MSREKLRREVPARMCRLCLTLCALFAVACQSDTSVPKLRRQLPTTGAAAGAGGASSIGSAGSAGSAASTDAFGNSTQMRAGSSAATGRAGSGPIGMDCPDGTANATPITPTIWLVVDGSSSMNEAFGAGGTRWQTLRSTLMDPGGVVDSLQSVARIGLVIYSGGGDLLGGSCVQLVTVAPALDNFAAIDAAYPAMPIGMGTPTDKALEHVVTNLPVTNVDMLDEDPEPVYVVLATDGSPNDLCGGGGFGFGDSTAVRQNVIDVTTRGTQMGMDMFIISLAAGEAALQTHLEQVAQATQSKTPPFVPETKADLIATFEAIVGGATCLISLDGMVRDGQQCMGEVLLNGNPLACDSDDGWRLRDPSTVALMGRACDDFRKNKSQVHASFPCGVFVQ